jgi:hypothetical protein
MGDQGEPSPLSGALVSTASGHIERIAHENADTMSSTRQAYAVGGRFAVHAR